MEINENHCFSLKIIEFFIISFYTVFEMTHGPLSFRRAAPWRPPLASFVMVFHIAPLQKSRISYRNLYRACVGGHRIAYVSEARRCSGKAPEPVRAGSGPAEARRDPGWVGGGCGGRGMTSGAARGLEKPKNHDFSPKSADLAEAQGEQPWEPL